MSKTTTTLHIWTGGRRTTISLNETIVRLLEIYRGWTRLEIEGWLSDRLTDRLGAVPRGERVRPGLSRYATEEMLSQIVRPAVWKKFEEERYGIK